MKREESDFRNYYDEIEKIGEGGFSIVYKAKEKGTNNYRAIKVMDKTKIKLGLKSEYVKQNVENELNEIIKTFYNELKYLNICSQNNKNSVKYYEHFHKEEHFAIVMELCDGNLMNLIKEKKGFNIEDIREIIEQLNNSFKIMSQNKIAHRDLKLENILIKYENIEKTKYTLKLSDYGVTSRLLSLSQRFSTKVGTPSFMAPEILKINEQEKEKYGIECDLWSLGVILYLLYFKNFPYPAETEGGILKQIKDQGIKFLKTSGEENFDDLIRRLLVIDPKKRMTWEEYFKHPFFKKKIKSEINMIVLIGKNDKEKNEGQFKNIYFLENDLYKEIGEQVHNFINELNANNSELYINDEQVIFSKYFKPEKEGEYKIKIIIKEKIKNCSHLFWGCGNIISIDLSSFDSSEVTDMSHMFSTCYGLEEVNLNNLNTEKVTDMSYMFNKCSLLSKITFPKSFNTQNVLDMDSMFHWCQALSEINFSPSFITNKVTNMHVMFGKCYILKRLDLTNFNTEKVKEMGYMFDQCRNLEEILINPTIFITREATSMGHMFSQCNNLKRIDLHSFNTNKVEFFNHMFNECQNLTNLDLSIFNNSDKANLAEMFKGCSNLKSINLNSFKIGENNTINGMLDDLPNIEKIIVNENFIDKYKETFEDKRAIFSTF